VIAHDFSTRLTQFDRRRRRTYARGIAIGLVIGITGTVFFAWYLWVGMGKQ
jgi:hypothetical protein